MSDATDKSSQPARYENGRFGPGNPGRRPGARGRMGHRVTMAILEDFLAHKDKALATARYQNAPAYLNTILRLLPTQAEPEPADVRNWCDADVRAAMSCVRAALTHTGDDRDALIALEALLLEDGRAEPFPADLDHRINGD